MRRVNRGDETTAIVDPHLLRFGDREAAQNRVAPRVIVERSGLMRETEDASVVDDLVRKLTAEQGFVDHKNIGVKVCDYGARSRSVAIDKPPFGRWRR